MKLRYSPTSPYVRKVVVTAIEAGLDERIERVETDVWSPETDIAEDNPWARDPRSSPTTAPCPAIRRPSATTWIRCTAGRG